MKPSIFYTTIFLILWTCGTAYSQDQRTDILQQDLSCLFDSLNMIGVLGDDCSRIDIRFTESRKMNHEEYKVKGASRTRLSVICPFEGKVCIDSISSCPRIKSECTEIGGFIYGYWCLLPFTYKSWILFIVALYADGCRHQRVMWVLDKYWKGG